MKYNNELLNKMSEQTLEKIDSATKLENFYHKIESHKKGGSIHIKPENKGKFTKSAKNAGKSVQQHARDVVNNPNATTLQKRRAQFAINAKKWHKK